MPSKEKYGELLFEDSNKFIINNIKTTIRLYILIIICILFIYPFMLFSYNNRIDNRVIDEPFLAIFTSILFGGVILLFLFSIKRTLKIKLQIYSNGINIVRIRKYITSSEFIPYTNILHMKKRDNSQQYENIVLKIKTNNGIENYIIGTNGEINTENLEKIYSLLSKRIIINENN